MTRKIGLLVLAAGRQAGGPEVYEHEIIRAIARIDQTTEYHIFCTSQSACNSFSIEQGNFVFHCLRPGTRLVSLPWTFPRVLKQHGIDFYHATYAPAPCVATPFVFSHHCFSYFAHPEFYPRTIRLRLEPLIRQGLKQAELILCVSEDVRQRTIEQFRLAPDKLRVIYHGVNNKFTPMNPTTARHYVSERFQITAPYLLVVGKLEKRKNLQRTLQAFAQFRKQIDTPVKLVLAGKRTWHNRDLEQALVELGLQEHVIETGYVDQQTLNYLYSASQFFVFASLWEGFGMPILEAMQCGAPVITSNISAMPEVAGGAALLVDPYNVEELASAMLQLFENPRLCASLRQRGIEHASQFTWQKAAEQTLEAYQFALHEKR